MVRNRRRPKHKGINVILGHDPGNIMLTTLFSFCVIPKLFPYGELNQSMKLTRAKLMETLRRKNEGWTTYQARKIAHISIRRVNQVWTEYQKTGRVPVLGKRMGRPKRPVKPREREMVKAAYARYREKWIGIILNHILLS